MKIKYAVCAAVLAFSCTALLGLSACTPTDEPPAPDPEPEYAFLFTGGGEIGGTDYTVAIEGTESSATGGTFALTIEELPALGLRGTYEFDSGKGYRLTFSDKNDTIVVPKYDTSTHLFTLKYNLNLGETLGSGEVVLTYEDTSFTPGDEVWFEPFSFYGYNDNVMGMTTLESTLFCYEDGTCMLMGVCPLTSVPVRNGTYTYDSATNVYSFVFEPQSATYGGAMETEFATTYDEATNTYTVTVEQSVQMKISMTLTYTPEA